MALKILIATCEAVVKFIAEMNALQEHLTKASHDAGFLTENLRAAHKASIRCTNNRFAEQAIFDALAASVELSRRINDLAAFANNEPTSA